MNIDLFPALPEIFIVIMILVMLLVDAFVHEQKKSVNSILMILTLIGAYLLQLFVYIPFPNSQQAESAFNGMMILDGLAQGMSLLTYILGIISVIYIRQYVIDKKILRGEFYIIFLFAIFGMLIMITANNMLILYLGLELLSLALYGLIAINRDNFKSTESAMKFFILSALASGILLYGISFIYGATGGNLQLDKVYQAISDSQWENSGILTFGLVFIVAGLVFKLGLVPFHMWVPDVYEGAPLPVAMIIASVTKIAAVVFMLRFLIGGLALLGGNWAVMLSMLAFLSLIWGNIAAIAQSNIKRMLGYSTIAQMAFVVFGLMTLSSAGVSAMLFYIVTYAITALAGFGVLILLSHDNYECEKISDLKGLSKSHPVYAGIMLLVMLSFAGIPPLVGFYAKFKILEALMQAGYVRSVIFVLVMSVIAAFYYLRVIKFMYFDEKDAKLRTANVSLLMRFVLVLNGLALLVLGIMPNWLMGYCLKLISG